MEAASAYASVTPTTELSEEVMKNKALSITDEYLNIRDIKVSKTFLFIRFSSWREFILTAFFLGMLKPKFSACFSC